MTACRRFPQLVLAIVLAILFMCLHDGEGLAGTEKHKSADESIVPHASLYQDPVDFFLGTKKRPRIEIVTPKQGETLETGVVEIEIAVKFPTAAMLWKPPSKDATDSIMDDNAVDTTAVSSSSSSTEEFDESHLHGSAICLSVVSTRGSESEDCFYPSERMFHVEGLAPGQTYSIKFTLFGIVLSLFCIFPCLPPL